MAKQNHAWRMVAAAMAESDPAAARRHLDTLATPPTAPVIAVALRLCDSARLDERRAGVLLVDALLDQRSDLPEADRLRAAQAAAR